MSDPPDGIPFSLRFDGLDATNHQLDMRLLGRTLIGVDRVVSDAVILGATGRTATAKDRRELTILISAPRAACVELPGLIATAGGLLPIITETLKHPGPKYVFEFLSFLLKHNGGKPKEAEVHLMKALDLAFEDRQHERETFFENEADWRAHSLALAALLTKPLREMVAPLGPSAETLTIQGAGVDQTTVIDVPMAEALRSNEALEVGDMNSYRVKIDGLIKHSRQLKVELLSDVGIFVNAEVRDPAFDTLPNIYTKALDADGVLIVQAKPTYRSGTLHKLHIMDASEA